MFGDLNNIALLSDSLLASFKDPVVKPNHLAVMEVLKNHLPYLALYTTFVSSFPTITAKIHDLRRSSAEFREALRVAESHERSGRLRMEDWLLTVVQRVPRWCMLLQQLMVCSDDPEVEKLLTRVESSKSSLKQKNWFVVARKLDENLREHENALEILNLQSNIVDFSEYLLKPGRRFVKQGK